MKTCKRNHQYESTLKCCPECRKQSCAEWYEANKKYKKQKSADWKAKNPEYQKQKMAEWYQDHKGYHAQYNKNRMASDPNFKLKLRLRTRLNNALKNNQKSGSAVKDLGCSIEELKSYLESKFLPGMTWENWSKHGWHIDHIVPLASFDLSDPDQFLKACHYTNLQPLWWKDNLKKSGKKKK